MSKLSKLYYIKQTTKYMNKHIINKKKLGPFIKKVMIKSN